MKAGEILMRKSLFAGLAIVALTPTLCFAQASTATGAAAGAATGAVVGGPVGAVVGGVAGATVGMAAEPPAEVRTYVTRERVPSVSYSEEIVVGKPVARSVQLRTIPKHKDYRFAVINNKRVIVEPKTRKIIQIIE
jgi:Protein of unknown function (DUF1236)